ncbi:20758_t:CDS:2 [Rhizophagus irregularis]|nr:20758_t:CDS:2 [Rhizophagus irregularis]
MTKSFSKDANILSLEEEEIIKGLDYPVSLFMDTSNEVIKQKYTNSLSKSFMTHESILISGRETLLSKKYDKESKGETQRTLWAEYGVFPRISRQIESAII